MGAHVIFFGPSTAGKTSLMLGLTQTKGEYQYNVDRTWTSRSRRYGESDQENIIVDPGTFDKKRGDFLFTFQTYPTYEYGIEPPSQLADNEVRMRILMPIFAIKFRSLVPPPVVLCSIAPYCDDPRSIFLARDPAADPADLKARMDRFYIDRDEADKTADVCFQNIEGLDVAVHSLQRVLECYFEERGI